jgi:tRNA A-37 threonylcarbamoyl transferase component Bud32
MTIQAEVAHPRLHVDKRRRRPTGAPPPLPRHIGITGKIWLGLLAILLLWALLALKSPTVSRRTERADSLVLRAIATLRTGWLTSAASFVDDLGSGYAITVLALGLIVALLVFRRWRHLFTFLGSIAIIEFVGSWLYEASSRPRPYAVTTIGGWAGYSMPAMPVAVLTTILLAITYTMIPAGRSRDVAKLATIVIAGLFVASRVYLGVDRPSDVFLGLTLSVAVTLSMFRTLTPNEVFPVTYRRAKTAHLDVGGRRGEAIRQALHDQLGLTVLDIDPVGLEGSGGSTPLRLCVAGEPNTFLFGKLYAMSHVRADRWYKLGRTILYGRLEDEAPFQTVRRLVEYEDYAARVLRDAGIPTAAPHGIVEITPEREYLLVTEFLDGAKEIGVTPLDDPQEAERVIDGGLAIVRQLWDAGLAHRDIKPANLLVRDGSVRLIDAFFVQVRPSPWRQAVDLANMMLVLAVRTDAQRVYERALRYFTPDEIAEAFAATRGVASPTQLRAVMKRDGRDLLSQFRALAPKREPVALQRWSVRRVALAAAVLAGGLVSAAQVAQLVKPGRDIPVTGSPECGTSDLMILIAQAVPSATLVPCIAALPAGWELERTAIRHERATFWFDSAVAGRRAAQATLRPEGTCDTEGASLVPTDVEGAERYERPEQLLPTLETTRIYIFDGACVTYTLSFDQPATSALLFEADQILSFQPRQLLVDEVARETGLDLCGAGTDCPGGD